VEADADGEAAKMEVVKSPMPGTIVKAFCEVGQVVKKDEPLISVESMKMEFLIKATHDVKIKQIRYASGDFVQKGEKLIIFEDE
jgi:3-methylcrotonyl-CoA carboxylase alpha subunit